MFKLLTSEWLFWKAIIGLAAGYLLRMLEHWAWERSTNNVSTVKNFLLFSIMVLAQSICIGLPLAYLLLLLIAKYMPDETVLTISAYLLAACGSFLAVDLRELLRRITKIF
jgi:ABC-type phosphate transport system permease subunit